jgi:hypothetical protein
VILDSLGRAAENFAGVFSCLFGSCEQVQSGGVGFGIALFVVLLFTGAGAYGTGMLLQKASGLRSRTSRIAAVAASAVFWLWLAFGHAVPQCAGLQNLLGWTALVPLYTAYLAAGFILAAGCLLFVWMMVRRRRILLPAPLPDRLLVTLLLVGLVVGWRYVFIAHPELAAGPFDAGPQWAQDGLAVWALEWPARVLWGAVTFLSTVPGLVTFAAVAGAAVVLPAVTSGGKAARAGDAAAAVLEFLVLAAVLLAAATLTMLVTLEEFLTVAGFVVIAGAMLTLVARYRFR